MNAMLTHAHGLMYVNALRLILHLRWGAIHITL